jgi:hypothetical protein
MPQAGTWVPVPPDDTVPPVNAKWPRDIPYRIDNRGTGRALQRRNNRGARASMSPNGEARSTEEASTEEASTEGKAGHEGIGSRRM